MGRHRRSRQDKEVEVAEEQINQMLVESGKREMLRQKLVERLEESGWKDQIKMACRDVVKERGIDRVTVETLVQEVAPKGSQLVPDNLRMELLADVRDIMEQHADD